MSARMMLASAFALAVTATGCYSSTIHLAEGPGQRSPAVDNAFHFNLIDLVEVSAPIDLAGACGGGQPVSIDEGVSFLGGLVNIVLSDYIPILSTMNASVNCGAGGAPPSAPTAAR